MCYNFQSLCFKVFFVKLNWSLNISLKKLNWTFDWRRNDSFWKIMKNCAKYDRRHLWWEIIIIVNKKTSVKFRTSKIVRHIFIDIEQNSGILLWIKIRMYSWGKLTSGQLGLGSGLEESYVSSPKAVNTSFDPGQVSHSFKVTIAGLILGVVTIPLSHVTYCDYVNPRIRLTLVLEFK